MNGTITKYSTDKGTRWRARWSLPSSADGVRRERSKSGFPTKAAASKFLRETLAQQDRGVLAPAAREVPTVGQAATAWLEERSADVRPTTLDNWRVALMVHVVPRIGGVKVTAVKPETVARVLREVSQQGKAVRLGKGADGETIICRTAGVTCRGLGCSPERHEGLAEKSTQHVAAALRALLQQAVEDGIIAKNPADEKRAKRAVPERINQQHQVSEADYWREQEAQAFLAHRRTAGDRHLALWELALATGLRKGELAGLTWQHVDLDRVDSDGNPDPEVRVRRSKTVVRGKVVVTEGRGRKAGKTPAAHREVKISPTVVDALRALRAQQAADRLAAPPGTWIDAPEVFRERNGAPIHPSVLGERWAAAVKASGQRHIGIHGARHYAISTWITGGVSILQVAKTAGHADAGVTLRVYAHLIREDGTALRAAQERTLSRSA